MFQVKQRFFKGPMFKVEFQTKIVFKESFFKTHNNAFEDHLKIDHE